MTIDKVEVTNSQGNLLAFSLDDISNGYIVEDIGGLDPVKATIVSSAFATMNGQQYQASSRETRNITMQLGYAPDYSIDQDIPSLRYTLYQYFMPGAEVLLTFYLTQGTTVNVTGRVESCEAALFTQEPAMNISIICFDPDFVDTFLVVNNTFTTTDTVGRDLNVYGTVSGGLESLSFTVATTLSEFTIYHTTPSGDLRTMLVSAPLILGDIISICTVKGRKSISKTRTGVTTSLLWAVSPQSDWVELEPGLNKLYLNASSSNPSAISLKYYNRYGGL